MAITAGTTGEKAGSAASDTSTIDIGTVTDGLLVVVINQRSIGPTSVSGITWNAVALTEVSPTGGQAAATQRIQIFYLVAPTNGSADLVSTFSGSSSYWLSWSSWNGVDSTPLNKDEVATGTGTEATVTITPDTDGQLIVAGYGSESNTLGTPDGDTALNDHDYGNFTAGASYHIQATAAARDMDWTGLDSDTWVAIAASFEAASGGASFIPFPRPRGLSGGLGQMTGGMI